MNGTWFNINLTGKLDPFFNKLKLLHGITERKPYLKLVHLRFLNWINENFEKHGAEKRWEVRSPNTIAAMLTGRGSHPPLRDTGRMAQSFTSGSRVEPSRDMVVIGSQDRKAQWHHFGTDPYIIRPKPDNERGLLTFVTVAGIRSLKEVHHPGLPARPLLPSKNLSISLAKGVLEAYLARVKHGET